MSGSGEIEGGKVGDRGGVFGRVEASADFPTMEKIQAALGSGAVPEVVYGRIEPPLVHFHSALAEALAAAAAEAAAGASTLEVEDEVFSSMEELAAEALDLDLG